MTGTLSADEWEDYRSVLSPFFGRVPVDGLPIAEEHACPYLQGRRAQEQFLVIDDFPPELYHDFMDHGFRRSGELIYRPVCRGCRECRSLRVIVDEFQPTKPQRRILRKNEGVEITVGQPRYSREKERIYSEYLRFRHERGESDSAQHLRQFLYFSPVRTLEFEYRLGGRLIAVSIADVCRRSLSSVYAFFDPELSSRSLGTFSALHEIRYCADREIPYYYLGFMIRDCPAMNYKARFRPHELLDTRFRWRRPPQRNRTIR